MALGAPNTKLAEEGAAKGAAVIPGLKEKAALSGCASHKGCWPQAPTSHISSSKSMQLCCSREDARPCTVHLTPSIICHFMSAQVTLASTWQTCQLTKQVSSASSPPTCICRLLGLLLLGCRWCQGCRQRKRAQQLQSLALDRFMTVTVLNVADNFAYAEACHDLHCGS